jgi:uracil-DNA glycosylase
MNSQFLKKKYEALASDGVENFPTLNRNTTIGYKIMPSPAICTINSLEKIGEVAKCTLCSLAKTRQTVIFSEKLKQKKFFILLEYPNEKLETLKINHEKDFLEFIQPESLVPPSPKQTTHVKDNLEAEVFESGNYAIRNLLFKLGIQNDSHISFALKCVPRKGIPSVGAFECAKHNLKLELDAINSENIFVFGSIAINAINIALQQNSHWQEGKNLFFFPSALELAVNPSWRINVWDSLAQFKHQSG